MKKSKVYTKTGDSGATGLVSGNRVPKSDARIDLYGEVDELNSRLGMVCSLLAENLHPKETKFLHMLQSALFDLGSNLACEQKKRADYKLPQLSSGLVSVLEGEIDRMDENLPPLKNFILPGGTSAASAIHLARTCARTVERKMVYFQQESNEELPANALAFMNRLSDYLFVLARYINKQESGLEVTWTPCP